MARAKITPRQSIWMAGYASRTHTSEGTLTDLWAKALVLEDVQGERALLITLDLVGLDREFALSLCDRLQKQYGFERRQIALCTSHTHSGPVMGKTVESMYYSLDDDQRQRIADYTLDLEEKLVELAGAALRGLQDVRIAWGQGHSSIAVNRRNNREPDAPRLREAGLLQGPVDHDVPVLAIRTGEGQPLAIVFGYACHATVLSGYEWSADYPGYAQSELEKLYPDATALFVAGCGGDQNALPRRQVPLAEQYGQSLARSVDAVLRAPMTAVEDRLATYYDEIPLAFADLPTRADLEQQTQSQDKYVALRGKALLAQVDAGRPLSAWYPYPVQLWTLGPALRWVILGGEVTVDYSLRLKRELGRERTWVASYSNDVMAYIPSLRVLREGGYEGGGAMVYFDRPAPWSAAVEETVVAGVHGLVAAGAPGAAQVDHSRLSVYEDDGRERAVRTREDWHRRREQILQGMQQAMGPLPSRTNLPALDVQVLDTHTGDGYTRQTISYVADDNDRVSAYLYLPAGAGRDARRAAVVALHPTGPSGKAIVDAQGPSAHRGYAKELAQRGYVVLAPDYPSFGDLKVYDFTGDRYVSGTMKGIVNNMRGIDLLASRDEVDPARIAAIGHSLGGHNAMFLGAFDERVKVVVSSCGWTPFHDYYAGKIAGWTSDRYMPRLKHVYGLDPSRVPFDFYEVVAALAPRAFFSVSPERDANFAVAGVRKAIPVASQVYALWGAADRLQVRYPACEHDFPDDSRREAYRFIDKILQHQPAREIP